MAEARHLKVVPEKFLRTFHLLHLTSVGEMFTDRGRRLSASRILNATKVRLVYRDRLKSVHQVW